MLRPILAIAIVCMLLSSATLGQVRFETPAETGPAGLVMDGQLIDVNDDGHLDLIATRSAIDARELWVADVNEDGLDDFGCASESEQILDRAGIDIFLGSSDGVFELAERISTGVTAQVVVAGHLNADAHVDLVYATFEGIGVGFVAGRGDGTFDWPRFSRARADRIHDIADFDVDGTLDLLVGVADR